MQILELKTVCLCYFMFLGNADAAKFPSHQASPLSETKKQGFRAAHERLLMQHDPNITPNRKIDGAKWVMTSQSKKSTNIHNSGESSDFINSDFNMTDEAGG